MNDEQLSRFLENRPRMLGIAYRMLGEMAAAEDVVQEAWLRWRRSDPKGVHDLRAWLSAVTVRLALDVLKSARAKRESYVGPWLPEPLLPDDMRALSADSTAARTELASDLSLALLHVLERLSPEERAAFILHDAFDCDYRDIAAALAKSEEACRKLVSRARERVKSERPRHNATADQHQALILRFAAASAAQDTDALIALFADDVAFYSDGGGRVPAALNPVNGASKVARLVVALVRKLALDGPPNLAQADINGRFALLGSFGDGTPSVLTAEVEADHITAIYLIRNPDKLARLLSGASALSSPGSSAFA